MSKKQTVALAALAVLSLVGCGSQDGTGEKRADGETEVDAGSAPRDATLEEFCAAFADTTALVSGTVIAEKLAAVGTPQDIPEPARRGFEYLIEHPEGGQEVIDSEDVASYVTYGSTTCAPLINGKG